MALEQTIFGGLDLGSASSGSVSSGNSSTTPPTVAAPHVGTWERSDKMNVMVTMACDVAGTLFFQFYDVDGTTPTAGTSPTSTFPVGGFDYNGSGFNEFHQAVKGPRWFRTRYVPDSDATTFRLNTYYVEPAIANLPINQSIPTDQDAMVTRAVLTAFDLNDNSRSLGLDIETIYNVATPTASSLPSGSAPTIDLVLNTEPNVLDSGWIDISDNFPGGQLIKVQADTSLTVYLMNASDDIGSNITGNTFATLTTTAGAPSVSGAPFFDKCFRVVIVNTSGSTATTYSVRSQGFGSAPAPVYSSIDSPVFGFFPAPLNKSVGFGSDPNGTYTDIPVGGTPTLSPAVSPLGISGNYTGDAIDCGQYPSGLLLIAADQESATNGLLLEWSDTSAFTTTRTSLTYTFQFGNISKGLLIPIRNRARYLRIKYTNGTTAQTRFFMNLKLETAPLATEVELRSASSGNTGQQTVTTAASAVGVVQLAGRKTIRLRNLSSSARALFFGFTAGLTIANGDQLGEGESVDLDLDEFVTLYVVTSGGGGSVECSWTQIA